MERQLSFGPARRSLGEGGSRVRPASCVWGLESNSSPRNTPAFASSSAKATADRKATAWQAKSTHLRGYATAGRRNNASVFNHRDTEGLFLFFESLCLRVKALMC